MEQAQTQSFTCNREHAISILLSVDPDLVDYVYHETEGRWDSSFDADFFAQSLGRERSTLVQIALDIWRSTNFSSLTEIFEAFSQERFEAFIIAMEQLKTQNGCSCRNCNYRFFRSSFTKKSFERHVIRRNNVFELVPQK